MCSGLASGYLLPVDAVRESMSESSPSPKANFQVVVNDEGQYSIWPVEIAIPPGWRDAGVTGAKEDCLERIGELWQDMRPLSLRE